MKSFFPQECAECINVRNVEGQRPPVSRRTALFQIEDGTLSLFRAAGRGFCDTRLEKTCIGSLAADS